MSEPTKDAPAFDFYPERWTHGTRLMNKVERSDYLDLLCHQWTDDGLPDDLELMARLLGYKRAAQLSSLVLAKFPVSGDGKRRNQLLEKLRLEQRHRIAKRREGAHKTNAKRYAERPLSDTPSERSATPERPESDIASASPPPTTHHPPQLSLSPRPALSDALAAADMIGITEAEAEEWWNAREASDWMKGVGGGGTTPVGQNWQADAKTFTNRSRDRKAEGAQRGKPQGYNASTPAQTKDATVWQLKQAEEAVNESIRLIDSTIVGAWGDLTPERKIERRQLVERRKEIRRKLAGLAG
jgi:hypothetical protein